ncbi:alpha-mannosidase [Streptomyces lunaelactis]|uniref:alpha-mannosidase n=1 Tax=Streptomyces lunaelactis TaxID=1535768 RepID=UPI001584B2F8|nr:glycoside hydrolase family 38 C-terminal domain-containing protein [Streptomyces lunaelactis]NUK06919.1 alpha-mannosidase [Streptomyces lunaelactis]NUK71842.1 alpha-mannosidase [Streptomyces lunaelactis]NUK77292.1 alpha-mannosidase [Streptomyces lunaelactis]NUL11093.1 alpha-mannosidase [Streptomyces lunaelactis]NUL21876.1 alpha-mannosidase [Streptomyces lunaelactis]
MHDDRSLVEARLRRVLDERIRPAVYPQSVPLQVAVWIAPGEPVPVAEGFAGVPEPIAVGDAWGAPWGTSWFRVTGTVPAEWAGKTVEAILDLGFDENMPGFQCEGLVHRPDGSPVKGLNPRNQWVRIGAPVAGGEEVQLHIEAASNPVILGYPPFLPTRLGDKETAGTDPQYKLARMDLAVFDETVWQLVLDLEVLGELMQELPVEGARRWDILRAIGRALDAVDLQDVNATAAAARSCLEQVLSTPAGPTAHRISAVGHAHIDSAWLWPLRETVRKVARTASNMTALLEDEPDFIFTMSQAQQFAWIKEHRPEVYAKVKTAVAEGRFVPAGGMWVESDTNMPGSEAMARQFVHGKRFFLDEFGIENDEAWLPDTFGFAAGLPQIIRAAGAKWLLTQKISWSRTNTFPHHTFQWEGIDGTRIFTHFPPVDTYNCSMKGSEIAHAAKNFKDKGVAKHSLAPTGWGDGGGGTTREMVAKAARLRDLEGSATVRWETPADFFTKAEAEYPNAPVWVGELYLELHRATLTSQAKTKQGNRRSEHLLREAELWAATAAVRTGFPYPYEQLDRVWKTVLLHQFHDILPGSSIAWVHREAAKTYAAVAEELTGIIDAAQRALAGDASAGTELVFNAAPHERHGVAGGGAAVATAGGSAQLSPREGGGFVLDNGLLQVEIDERGLVVSAYDIGAERETVAPGLAANLLQIHPDFPNMWDAWDVDEFYRNTVTDLTDADEVAPVAGDTAAVRVVRSFGDSKVTQVLTLAAGAKRLDIDTEVDWHETEKFLKASFPLDIHAERYASETQFGHFHRATHTNTSWEAAKFEACNHRFVHMEEPGWGVALVNDSTYGHDVTRTVRDSGPGSDSGTTTTLRVSLLRAPRFPDPETDQGVHRFRHALVPGAVIGDAVREGFRINLPERRVSGDAAVAPLVTVDNEAVVVSAVKLADDASGDVVVRLYESGGGRARARVTAGFEAVEADVTDLLERPLADAPKPELADGAVRLMLRPFELVTLRLTRSQR